MMQFQDKWALVTGASSGIGMTFAEKLAAAGAKLVLVARNEEALRNLAANLKQTHNTESIIILKDLSKLEAAQEVYDEVNKAGISVDILINDAGFGTYGHLHTQNLERNQQLIMLNIIALTSLTQLFLADMAAKKSGIIINLSSLAAFVPLPNFSVYSASKAYVQYLTTTLATEYQQENIQFLSVCPGSTKTNFFKVAKLSPHQKLADPSLVVDQALKALEQKKMFVICGSLRNKIIGQMRRLFSLKILSKIVTLVNRKK